MQKYPNDFTKVNSLLKYGLLIGLAISTIYLAYKSAGIKLSQKADLSQLHLSMTTKEVEKAFGTPFEKKRNEIIYIFNDDSELRVSTRENIVTSALLKYRKNMRVDDPTFKSLTLVQMDPGHIEGEEPSWFFAGKPEEGKIFKINKSGEIESVTWVTPFTYGDNRPKKLHALLEDFRSRKFNKL